MDPGCLVLEATTIPRATSSLDEDRSGYDDCSARRELLSTSNCPYWMSVQRRLLRAHRPASVKPSGAHDSHKEAPMKQPILLLVVSLLALSVVGAAPALAADNVWGIAAVLWIATGLLR